MIAKIVGAIWPFMVFPVIITLNLLGYLDFGAGEKDIILAVPMLVFSLCYLFIYLFFVKRKKKTYAAVIYSSLISFFILFLISIMFSKLMGVRS